MRRPAEMLVFQCSSQYCEPGHVPASYGAGDGKRIPSELIRVVLQLAVIDARRLSLEPVPNIAMEGEVVAPSIADCAGRHLTVEEEFIPSPRLIRFVVGEALRTSATLSRTSKASKEPRIYDNNTRRPVSILHVLLCPGMREYQMPQEYVNINHLLTLRFRRPPNVEALAHGTRTEPALRLNVEEFPRYIDRRLIIG
jgi:hypothetical protein